MKTISFSTPAQRQAVAQALGSYSMMTPGMPDSMASFMASYKAGAGGGMPMASLQKKKQVGSPMSLAPDNPGPTSLSPENKAVLGRLLGGFY